MATGYLHNLCHQGNVATIQSYLEEVEDVRNKLEEHIGFLGYTPLHEAISQGHTNVVRLLLQYGANANSTASGLYTPLHVAASMDNTDCVVELLNHDADITSKDEFGKTPYETARILKSKKSAQILKTEEIKKAAQENSPNLQQMLTSITPQNVLPSCFKQALLEASKGGHLVAICTLIIAGGKWSLKLKDCISEALKFHFYEAAAMLLTCYAARHDKIWLLKYLLSAELSRQEEGQALAELPRKEVTNDVIDRMRLFIADKETFRIAVPIGLVLKQRKKDTAGIILMNTNCDRQQKRVNWAKLVLGDIDPAWLENIKWAEKLLLSSNFLSKVPSNLHTLDKLSVLDLRRNRLKSIPACLLEMPSLCDLKLSENQILELPKKCNWSPSLKSLYLNDNLLKTLPRSMSKARLSTLHLARNNLFEMPSCINKITTLQSLDVSDNPRLMQLSPKVGKLTNSEALKVDQEAEGLTDLDKLYLALAEVGAESEFNKLCYNLGITSIHALKDYKPKHSVILHPDEVNRIKKKIGNTRFKFDQLAQKYKRSDVVETCKTKGIPVIQKQDVTVTQNIVCAHLVGYVCEAQWTKPDGIKEKVCLRYGETRSENFVHEAEMANVLRHKNILDFHGVVIASSYSPSVALVEEFAEYGNLDESSSHHSVERLSRFTIEAATALEYLEKKNVVHQSLSLHCMVVADYQMKLAGIGYCEFEGDLEEKRELGFQYVNREDVIYGFAKLFSGAFASYQNRAPGFEVAKNVMESSRNPREVQDYLCPSHFCDVFDRCLRDNPKERPASFSEIRQSLVAKENHLKVKVTSSFNAETTGFISCKNGELITLISKDRHREDKNLWLGETQSREVGFFGSEHVEEVLDYDITDDSSIPPEIRARGPRAERAFQRAMQKGRVKVYRGRIMILGQDRAGKTSLKKSLLGMPFDPGEESTIGVDVDPSKCKLEVDQVKNWEPTGAKKLDVSEFVEDIARLIARDLNETADQDNVSNADSPALEELLRENLPSPTTETTPDASLESNEETDTTEENDPESTGADNEPEIHTTAVLPEDVTELVVRYLQNLKLEDVIKAKEVLLTLWDFAGQHLYYASHSVFLSARAIYLLVYNLSKSLSAQAEPCVRQGTHDIRLDNPNNETNLDNLLSWLVSVDSIFSEADQAGRDFGNQASNVPYLRPPVLFVGTNADRPSADTKNMEKCIQKSISGKTYEKHVIRPFFAVDNTKSHKDDGVQKLRKKIIEVLEQEPYMGEEVPLRWFNFEKVVEALVAKETYHMDLNQLLTVTRQVCHINDEDELAAMLNFYHDLGVIVKHGSTVVLQAQWLIDLFKQLITVRPFDEVNPLFSECWLELEESGILRMALVDHVFTDFIQKGLNKQDILDIMELYGLIAKFSCLSPESEQEQTYFVPCQLRSPPSGLCEIMPSEDDPCPLYVHFLDGFVPHGLFPQLLSKCIHWCSEQGLKQAPQLYLNGARLFIAMQGIFDLILICRKRFIKVILKRRTPSSTLTCTSTAASDSSRMAGKVREFIEATLQSLSSDLSWLCNVRYELCVSCTYCLQSTDQCVKHSSERCTHDDCLHLLPLLPNEELICPKSFCDETVKVHGLEKWFHKAETDEPKLEQLAPRDPHTVGVLTPSVPAGGALDQPLSLKPGTPSSDDLLLIAVELGPSWKMLGRALHLPENVLEEIEEDERRLFDKCYGVLRKWTEAFGSAATYQDLARALQHPIVGLSKLATKYCDVCSDTLLDYLPLHMGSTESDNCQGVAEVRFVTLEEKTVFDKVQFRSGGVAKQRVQEGMVHMEARFPVGEIRGIKVWVFREPDAAKLHQDQNGPISLQVIHGKHDVEKYFFSVNLDSVNDGPYGPVYNLAKVEADKRNLFQLLVELSFHNGLEEETQQFYSKPFLVRTKPRTHPTDKEKKRKLSEGSEEQEASGEFQQLRVIDHLEAKRVHIEHRSLVVSNAGDRKADMGYHFKLRDPNICDDFEKGDVVGFFKDDDGTSSIQLPDNKNGKEAFMAGVITRSANLDARPPMDDNGDLPSINKDNSPCKDSSILSNIVTSDGGVVVKDSVRLVCPPGAVEKPVSVNITLVDPSNYYELIVQKDLENDVMFAAPIINLEPNGLFFKKPLTLVTKFKIKSFKWDDVLILHGSRARDGKITWQDITFHSKIDDANGEVSIETEHFSLIAVLVRFGRSTLIRTKEIVSRLNLLSFNYTLSVLLNKSSPSLVHDELALLFVSQEVYHDQFYREDETSALMQLKKDGFVELHVCSITRQKEKSIYNNENLQINVHLGEDYQLADGQQEKTSFTVHSYVWWNTGLVIRLSLEWKKDVRSLCGKISVQGEYGHTSERHFREQDLCGYVRSLLCVEGAIFNLIPIAQLLEMPEESMNQVAKCWNDEEEQLELILQHWSKNNDVVEDLAALRKDLESLQQKDYMVTKRGQMHIRHLRNLATKIMGLQRLNADSVNYFVRKIQTLCKSVLKDCCIELKGSTEAASSESYAEYLIQSMESHRPLPEEIARKYHQVCSSSETAITQTLLIIVPYLIQNIKDIFVDERISEVPQNGLRGLPKEEIDHFVSSIRNAEGNNRLLELVCESCNILEQLCLINRDKQLTAEIEKWGKSLTILPMLNFLKPFFQHCRQDVRLHQRLDLFSCRLRDIMANREDIDEVFVHDLSNLLLSLVLFAKFDPSKLVRFELIDSANFPLTCPRENVRYDKHEHTYSQVFRIKKELEGALQLHAIARVYNNGKICEKGTFQSEVILKASSKKHFHECSNHFEDVTAVKLEDNADTENLRVVLCATQKGKLSEFLDVLKQKLGKDVVDLYQSEVTQCRLTMRTVTTKAGAVVSLRLVYKWGSEAVFLSSEDFVTFADLSGGCLCTPKVQDVEMIEEGILLQQLSLSTDKQPEEGSTIRDNANDLQIFIKMVNGQIIALAVKPNDFIKNVKKKIQQLNECPPDRQRLVFAGKKLEEDHTLSDYNVQNGSTLILVQRLRDAPMDAAG